MKLLYKFEFMDMNGEIVAVPVGDKTFSGILKVSEDTKEILELIEKCNTPDEVLNKLLETHPEEKKNELGQELCDLLNKLVMEGLLDPRPQTKENN